MAIPSLLATSAVHHQSHSQGLRTSVGLVVETGEANEVHQFCTLAGYGAEAINPYLAFETLEAMLPQARRGRDGVRGQEALYKAVGKAMMKVMAKMGISTYQSVLRRPDLRRGGPQRLVRRKYFTGTHTQMEPSG